MDKLQEREKQLILMAQKGDMSAFYTLINKYKEMGVRISFSVTDKLADAQDIAQEAFVRVFKNIKKFKFRSKFSTWFYRILTNLCRDFLRKKKHSRIILARQTDAGDYAPKPVVGDGHNPAKALLNKELGQAIDEAITELSEKQQIVFILKHKKGLKIEQIAEMLGMKSSTVKVHLFRALRKLQKKLHVYLQSAA